MGTGTPLTSLPVSVLSDVLVLKACISLLRLHNPRAKRKTVLKVKFFKEASSIGSNGAFVSWCNTRDRFQEGISLHPLDLSL